MVAATASLMLTVNPSLTPEQIEAIIMATATDMDDPGWDDKTGAGLLDATAALKAVEDNFVTIKLTKFDLVKEDKKLKHVDVYGSVLGPFKDITLGIGKGKRARRFKEILKLSNTNQADHALLARLTKDDLCGSDEWMVQLKVTDNEGRENIAQALLLLDPPRR